MKIIKIVIVAALYCINLYGAAAPAAENSMREQLRYALSQAEEQVRIMIAYERIAPEDYNMFPRIHMQRLAAELYMQLEHTQYPDIRNCSEAAAEFFWKVNNEKQEKRS